MRREIYPPFCPLVFLYFEHVQNIINIGSKCIIIVKHKAKNFKKDFLFIIKKTFKTDSKCEVSVTHASASSKLY